MKSRWIALFVVLGLFLVACDDGDAQLSPTSTLITGPTDGASEPTTTDEGAEGTPTTSPTTLVGESVSSYRVVATFPNDNGETQHIVIADGAYTDVDLENFVIELLESNPDLYGAEIFDDDDAATAFQVDAADRTEEEQELLGNHHYVSLVGRDRYEFRGPFAGFTGGAIGS